MAPCTAARRKFRRMFSNTFDEDNFYYTVRNKAYTGHRTVSCIHYVRIYTDKGACTVCNSLRRV